MADRHPLEKYLGLRTDVSERAARLFDRYDEHLRCRRGCYYCCDEITVLPIELEALRLWTAENGMPARERLGGPPPGPRRRCAFLGRSGECTVYGGRPIICRTHGLPLAYRVYEYDLHGREVAPEHPQYTDLWCDLNFTTLGDEGASRFFDQEGRINMDEINRGIEELNAAFLDSEAGSRYRDLPPGEDRLVLGVLLR